MSRKGFLAALLTLPLAAAGLVFGQSLKQRQSDDRTAKDDSYTCPLTGEQLPCPNCCPLNKETKQPSHSSVIDEGQESQIL